MKARKLGFLLPILAALMVSPFACIFAIEIIQCPRYGLWLLQRVRTRQASPGREVEFVWRLSAHGRGPGGVDAEGFDFLCSDCVQVSTLHYTWSDPADA